MATDHKQPQQQEKLAFYYCTSTTDITTPGHSNRYVGNSNTSTLPFHVQESPPRKRFEAENAAHPKRDSPNISRFASRLVQAVSAWSVKKPTCSVPAL